MGEMSVQFAQVLWADTNQILPFQPRKRQTSHAAEQYNPLSLSFGSGELKGCPGGGYFVFGDAAGIHQDYLAPVDFPRHGVAVYQKKLHRFGEKVGAGLTPLARINNEDPASLGFLFYRQNRLLSL